MNYPEHAGNAEKAAWAFATGIDAAIFIFGCVAMGLMLLYMVGEYISTRKR